MSERISATPNFTSRVHTRGQLMRTVGWAPAQSRQMEFEIKNKQKNKKMDGARLVLEAGIK